MTATVAALLLYKPIAWKIKTAKIPKMMYDVQKGDTLDALLLKEGLKRSELRQGRKYIASLNKDKIKDPEYKLRAGDEIIVGDFNKNGIFGE